MTTKHRRSSGRLEADFGIEIRAAGRTACGRTLNLSEEGVLVLADGSFGVDEPVWVWIQYRGASIRVAAVVRWLDAGGSLDAFVLGLRFLHVPATRKLLCSVLCQASARIA